MRLLIAPPCSGKSTVARALTEIVDGDIIPEIKRIYCVMASRWGPVWYFNEQAIAQKNEMMRSARITIEDRVDRDHILATAETGLPGPNDVVVTVIPTIDVLMFRNKSRRPDQFKYTSLEQAIKIHKHYGDWAVKGHHKVMIDVAEAAVWLLDQPASKQKFEVLR